MTGLNRRPSGCKPDALPTELIARPVKYKTLGLKYNGRPPGFPDDRPSKFIKRRSVDRVFQAFTCLELRLLGSRNLYGRPGPRIAAGRCLAIGDAERAKTNEANGVAALQCFFDIVENCIDCLCRIGFGQAGVTGDGRNKIVFIHCRTPFWTGKDRCRWIGSMSVETSVSLNFWRPIVNAETAEF